MSEHIYVLRIRMCHFLLIVVIPLDFVAVVRIRLFRTAGPSVSLSVGLKSADTIAILAVPMSRKYRVQCDPS